MDHTSHGESSEVGAGIPTPRLRASTMARQSWAEAARREGDDNSLWVSAQSMWMSINNRYSRSQATGEDFAVDLHDLWFIYCQASMNISSQSPCQDRLALQILQAREQGALTRQNPDHSTTDSASTSDGVIWIDLPYLVSDMTEFWAANYATMSGSQRLNISAFLARLASVGVAGDRLCGIALMVLRETLETTRPIGEFQENENEDPSGTSDGLNIAALLPSVNVWLFHAGIKIVDLAESSWNDCPAHLSALGELLRQSSSEEFTKVGFSTQRWLYWLKRLQEIAETTGSVAEYACRVMDNMLLTVEQRDTTLKAEVESARDVITYRVPTQMLGRGPHE